MSRERGSDAHTRPQQALGCPCTVFPFALKLPSPPQGPGGRRCWGCCQPAVAYAPLSPLQSPRPHTTQQPTVHATPNGGQPEPIWSGVFIGPPSNKEATNICSFFPLPPSATAPSPPPPYTPADAAAERAPAAGAAGAAGVHRSAAGEAHPRATAPPEKPFPRERFLTPHPVAVVPQSGRESSAAASWRFRAYVTPFLSISVS